jgi:hypothetical protein
VLIERCLFRFTVNLIALTNMFFITEPDVNFRIKGSRDPLGFQSIWQKLGRRIIKNLSTVSVNIRDFQVMSFAWYFWRERPENGFMPFFYKFEQASAYAREIYFENSSYNGKEFVSKRKNDGSFCLSTDKADTILSNQKSYGIFGKYNRPFTEMKIKHQDDFYSVMQTAIKQTTNSQKLADLVEKIISEDVVVVTKDDLKPIADLLGKLSGAEKQYYEKHILENSSHKAQNELYGLLKTHPEFRTTAFQLYPFIKSLLHKNISEELKASLIEIRNTEGVLYSYANLFRHLQSRPVWGLGDIAEESLFKYFPKKQDYVFEHSEVIELNNELQYLKNETSKIAIAAVNRNEKVSMRRNNSAWIKLENNKLIRYYADGGREISKLDVFNEYENNYFLPTYISLFNQIDPVI